MNHGRSLIVPAAAAALLALTLACASRAQAQGAPLTLLTKPDTTATEYSFIFVDPAKLRGETVATAQAHTVTQLAAIGRVPAFVSGELDAAGLSAGPMHFGTFDVWTYNRETFLPNLASPPFNVTFDRGVKHTYGTDFRTPVLVTDVSQVFPVTHVHFDQPMGQFGFDVQTTAAAGGFLITDSLRIDVFTDVDHDGVMDTLSVTKAMTADLLEFVGVAVPSGFTDLTYSAIGGVTQSWVGDRWTCLTRANTLGVSPVQSQRQLAMAVASAMPFRERIALRATLPHAAHVQAQVFDAAGRLVRDLLDADALAGDLPLAWDGRDASGARATAGLYFARVRAGEESATRRLVMLR
jgi:hypothetical protein